MANTRYGRYLCRVWLPRRRPNCSRSRNRVTVDFLLSAISEFPAHTRHRRQMARRDDPVPARAPCSSRIHGASEVSRNCSRERLGGIPPRGEVRVQGKELKLESANIILLPTPPDCPFLSSVRDVSQCPPSLGKEMTLRTYLLVIVANVSNRLLMLASVPRRYCHAFTMRNDEDMFFTRRQQSVNIGRNAQLVSLQTLGI